MKAGEGIVMLLMVMYAAGEGRCDGKGMEDGISWQLEYVE